MKRRSFTAIEFEYVDLDKGFYISFRIPFSLTNLDAVIAIPQSRAIRLIK